MKKTSMLAIALMIVLGMAVFAGSSTRILTVKTNERGTEIRPSLFGIFIEDINHAVNGGLYANLTMNPSFEGSNPWNGWKSVIPAETEDSIEIASDTSISINDKNPNYVKVQSAEMNDPAELINSGFGGVPVEKGRSYDFSMYVRAGEGFRGSVDVAVKAPNGGICAQGGIKRISSNWNKLDLVLKAASTCSDARLVLSFDSTGTVYVNMVTLFPADNFHGMRADLVKMLEKMTPGYMRFPGGCFVNGNTLKNAFNWKNSIGPRIDRPTTLDFWGYDQSYGVGLYEYLLLAERLGATPVYVVNPGMAWQGEKNVQMVPLKDMNKWIQSTLNLIQFADGPTTSEWGKVRASLGHPKPFDLEYLEIGNENVGQDYYERFEMYQKAIEAKYPKIKLIFSVGPNHGGAQFDNAWQWAREHGVDVVDEHIYASPDWFLTHTGRYDSYSRKGPKVMLGEYAAQTWNKQNTLEAALAEAAFMTGLEKNSNEVIMASYAPLFNRVGWSQWVPDLIWFNGTQVYGTPSYYTQVLFSENRGDVVLPSSVSDNGYAEQGKGYKHLYFVTTYDSKTKDIIVKIVNPWPDKETCQIDLKGDSSLTGKGQVTVLSSDDPVFSHIPFHGRMDSMNSFENPTHVAPITKKLTGLSNSFTYTFGAYSLTILKIGTEGI